MRRPERWVAVCGVLALGLTSCEGSSTPPVPTPVAAIDHYISTEARLQTFSGTVLIAQNGKVVLEKAYGWAGNPALAGPGQAERA